MDLILTIHSINRWLIAAAAVVTVVKFAVGWLGRHEYQPVDRILMSVVTGLADLQALLGIILLIGMGVERFRIEHAVMMAAAIIILHLSALWRNASDRTKFRNNMLAIAAAMIIVVVGVSVLPQGW